MDCSDVPVGAQNTEPGYCFRMAGFDRVGKTKGGWTCSPLPRRRSLGQYLHRGAGQ